MSKLPEEAREFFRKAGSRGGKKGAKARMEKLSPAERTALARNAGKNRWNGKRKPKAKAKGAGKE